MKRTIRLTESDLIKLVRKVIKEQTSQTINDPWGKESSACLSKYPTTKTDKGTLVKVIKKQNPYRYDKETITYLYPDGSAKDVQEGFHLYWGCVSGRGLVVNPELALFGSMGYKHPLENYGSRSKDMAEMEGAFTAESNKEPYYPPQ